MPTLRILRLLPALASALLLSGSSQAFVWKIPIGTVQVVEEDSGAGLLSGETEFGFWYANAWPCEDGCVIEHPFPGETRYVYDASRSLGGFRPDYFFGNAPEVRTAASSIRIVDDGIADQALVDWAAPLGLAMTVGQEIDLLEFTGVRTGSVQAETIEWTIRAIYVTNDPYPAAHPYPTDDWYYYTRTNPPSSLGPDLLAFEVREGDGAVFSARGDIEIIPEAGFATGVAVSTLFLLLLGTIRRWMALT